VIASTQTVVLAGTGSVLEFEGTGFAGSISGLAEGDAILLQGSDDPTLGAAGSPGLQGIAAVSALISGNDLVVTPASGSAYDIALSGNVPSSATPIAVGSVTNGGVSVSFISIGGTSYTLAAGDTISGGAYDNLIVATAASLTAADHIDAGSGSFNAMILSGAGTFDLAAPASLIGVADFIANEGQAASGNIASTEQIIDTSAGQTGTITVETGTDNTASTNRMGIIINGAADSMTFDLFNAEGSDAVNLGSGNETVIGSSTNSFGTTQFTTINAAIAAEAGAKIVGSGNYINGEESFAMAAQTVLHVEAGGIIPLNTNDQDMTVDLSNHASTLNLGGLGFIVANGGAGNDIIRAGGANQTLSGGGGTNILVGSASGGDVFSDTSADLNDDTIKNFLGSDSIVATDMTFADEGTVSWTQTTATEGTLTIAGGNNIATVTLTGSFESGGFYMSANTAGTGVVVKYE
jgi:hypothetical protein